MTEREDQLDKNLRKALESNEVPPAHEAAKRNAIAMARAEFVTAQTGIAQEKENDKEKSPQGFFQWLRLIVRNQADKRRATMYADNKLAYGGIAAVAVGAIAVGITLQNQRQMAYEPLPTADYGLAPPEKNLEPSTPVAGYSIRPQSTRLAELEEAIVVADADVVSAPAPESPAQKSPVKPKAKPATKVEPRGARANYMPVEMGLAYSEPRDSVAKEPAAAPADPAVHAARERLSMDLSAVASMDMSAAVLGAPALRPDVMPHPGYREEGRDRFEEFEQNPVKVVSQEPVSTFSADVDTASYSFVRRTLNSGVLPQGDAVRAEELINYFDYDYPLPASKEEPFQPTVAVTDSPWADGRKLMHIGIKGYDIAPAAAPRSNLVFLLDVSGSMNSPDKLPLVKQSMELLLSTLQPDDTVAIAVYAGAAGMVLEPTPVKEKRKILGALRQLSAGGSTAGGQGIRLAYELAAANYDENAVNRVILATDGDFNVGIRSDRELQSFVERKRDEGIFLSVLGFGQGNYQDALMQTLAQNGNGVAAYIDTLSEAQKVLVEEATSTLFPIAKDVKFQVEFNPATVAEYRLIGYETRHLNREDFNNDAVDAGDIGAGHTVTAIYEFTPVGSDARFIEESRYAPEVKESLGMGSEYAFLKIRYKLPDEDTSQLITRPVTRGDIAELGGKGVGHEAGFATAVAGFAQLLKGGKYTGDYSYDDVIELALQTRGDDPYGYRNEFVQLVRKAKTAAAMR